MLLLICKGIWASKFVGGRVFRQLVWEIPSPRKQHPHIFNVGKRCQRSGNKSHPIHLLLLFSSLRRFESMNVIGFWWTVLLDQFLLNDLILAFLSSIDICFWFLAILVTKSKLYTILHFCLRHFENPEYYFSICFRYSSDVYHRLCDGL